MKRRSIMDNNERNDNVFDDRPTGELTFGRIFKDRKSVV